MSPLMRARSALTGRGEGAGVIGGFLFELKVAGPSMLAIGCPDRHPLPLIHAPPSPKTHRPRRAESRESGFVRCPKSDSAPRLMSASINRGITQIREPPALDY